MKLINLSSRQIRKYVRVGRYETEIRKLAKNKGESPDELPINRLDGFASYYVATSRSNNSAPPNKVHERFIDMRNDVTLWLNENGRNSNILMPYVNAFIEFLQHEKTRLN